MQNLGQFPVKINHHLSITDEERDALVNACAFFHWFFSGGEGVSQEWSEVARDSRIELFDQLATKIARG
jgi:hypothetical protein